MPGHGTKTVFVISLIIFLAWVSFFPETVQAHYAIYTKFFLGGLFLILSLQKKDIRFVFNRYDAPLLLFLVCILSGVFQAQDREAALKTYSDIFLILLPLYYLVKYIFLSNRNISIITRTICICSGIVAFFGFLEWIFAKNLIYEYFIANPYYRRFVNCYVQRPMSTQFNPAPLASYLLISIPFNFLLIRDRISFFRIFGAVSVMVSIFVLILTFSRGSFLGLGCLIIFYLWHKGKRLSSGLFLLVLILIVAVCSYFPVKNNFSRFGTKGIIYGRAYTSILSEYRIIRLKTAFRMLRDYPFFGVGLNNYRTRFDEYRSMDKKRLHKIEIPHEIKIADNMYLTLLAETGLVGVSGFFIFVFLLFRKGLAGLYLLQDKIKKESLLIALSALFGLLINMGGYELFYWHSPFALFCILCGIIISESRWVKNEN